MLKLMSKHLREDNSIKQDETIYMYIIRNMLIMYKKIMQWWYSNTAWDQIHRTEREKELQCTCTKFICTFSSCSERCFVVFLQHHSISFI